MCHKFRSGHKLTAWQIEFYTCTNVNQVAEDLQANRTVFIMSNPAALLTRSLVNVQVIKGGDIMFVT